MTRPPPTPPKVRRPEPAPRVPSPVIAALRAELAAASDPAGVMDRFWAQARSPIVSGAGPERVVTFLVRDAVALEVLLFVNRLTDETDLRRSLMERLPGTDLWHLTYRIGTDWRASYSVLRRGPDEPAPWRRGDHRALRAVLDAGRPDPLNPERLRNRAGSELSVVALPDAPPQPWLAARGPLRGELTQHVLDGRRVEVYRPAEIIAPRAPAVVVLDGDVWSGVQNLPTTVDNLVADREVPAPVLLLVSAADRDRRWAELDAAGGLPDWIADRLLPWATGSHGIGTDPAGRVVTGQSLGGSLAMLTAATRQDAVGGFVAQSSALWQPGVVERIADGLPATASGYVEVGRRSGCCWSRTGG